jgi:hypothetical protein
MSTSNRFSRSAQVAVICRFFLKHHRSLTNYSQIEACESFYILQNLVEYLLPGIAATSAPCRTKDAGIDVFSQETR